jgi:hypothetical protein
MEKLIIAKCNNQQDVVKNLDGWFDWIISVSYKLQILSRHLKITPIGFRLSDYL